MNETDSGNPESNSHSDKWKSWTPEEYLSILVHELRTPLMIIKSYLAILTSEDTKEHHQEALESISKNVDQMVKLQEGIIDYIHKLQAKS